jgi:pimeloyl-ACP methyl ester carboxylesterase
LGRSVAWTSALLRPDIFGAVGLLSVPYLAGFWSGPSPTSAMKSLLADGQMFYQLYFQEPGKAEEEFAQDPRHSLLRMFTGAAGGAQQKWRYLFSPDEEFLDTLSGANGFPHWLSEGELDFFAKSFQRTGFTGGLNWYRNMDRDHELLRFLAGARVRQPSVFLAGAEDQVIEMYQRDFEQLEQTMPGLTKKTLIEGAGHWVQQEKPDEVNRNLRQFLSTAWPNHPSQGLEPEPVHYSNLNLSTKGYKLISKGHSSDLF